MNTNLHHQRWQQVLHLNRDMVAQSNPLLVSGRLTKVTGLVMEAVGLRMAVGSTCWGGYWMVPDARSINMVLCWKERPPRCKAAPSTLLNAPRSMMRWMSAYVR